MLDRMLGEIPAQNDSDEATLPITILDEMEDFIGEPILFMGIS